MNFSIRSLGLMLGAVCLLTLLTACATTTPHSPPPIDSAKLSQFTIPETLPELDDPLGFLRPDAPKSRDDVKVIVENYRITDHKADTILIGRNGIRAALEERGMDYIARVDWRVKWDYDLEKRGGVCNVDDVDTQLTVTYQLPEWAPSEIPHPGLKTYWDAFEQALWMHEYGHAKIGYDAKNSIETAIAENDFQEFSCQTLAKKLNQTARDIIDRGLDQTYDAVTGHGQTQGAYYDVQEAKDAVKTYNRSDGQS